MKVYNPTKDTLTVQIKGVTYTVAGGETIENVQSEHAQHWKDSIHSFIVISNGDSAIETNIEVPIEDVVETPVVEEVIKEKKSKKK